MNMTTQPSRLSLLRALGIAGLVIVGVLLIAAGLGWPQIIAREEPPAKAETPAPGSPPSQETSAADVLEASLKQMAADLRAREEGLKAREEKASDAERRLEILAKRLGVNPALAGPAPDSGAPQAADAQSVEAGPQSDMMSRLLRSYESMEPENAAVALRKLFGIDRDAVVELISGMSPRKAGGVLDALAGIDPVMTAEVSHELWKRGKVIPGGDRASR